MRRLAERLATATRTQKARQPRAPRGHVPIPPVRSSDGAFARSLFGSGE
jgi:hypothetical protein